jgi:hypothetical protein
MLGEGRGGSGSCGGGGEGGGQGVARQARWGGFGTGTGAPSPPSHTQPMGTVPRRQQHAPDPCTIAYILQSGGVAAGQGPLRVAGHGMAAAHQQATPVPRCRNRNADQMRSGNAKPAAAAPNRRWGSTVGAAVCRATVCFIKVGHWL